MKFQYGQKLLLERQPILADSAANARYDESVRTVAYVSGNWLQFKGSKIYYTIIERNGHIRLESRNRVYHVLEDVTAE